MSMETLPTVFVSHGAPTLSLENVPARKFLVELGTRYRNVKAVLCISAHWNTAAPAVNSVAMPETIHDFYGFPSELYQITYPAHGSPGLAGRAAALLNDAGLSGDIDTSRGLDHGAWVPLRLMFPTADVPIVQLSIQRHLDPARHVALGEAIEPLRHEGVLVLGSGGAVHPLGDPTASLGPGAPTDAWAIEFNEWLIKAVTKGDREALIHYRTLAPYATHAHLYPDHYMPLLAAFGAAGPGVRGTVLHQSWDLGDLGMGAYEFA
ncbi:MAG: class III extradiol ring-cleavage dioxygenase [Methanoregula sp.]|nr:MAG: class III extradiol ring-cleavage dioxygenase [Methanoregula sp.]